MQYGWFGPALSFVQMSGLHGGVREGFAPGLQLCNCATGLLFPEQGFYLNTRVLHARCGRSFILGLLQGLRVTDELPL